MSFPRAVAFVLAREGAELVNDPADPGQLSRYGIALARHPNLTADDIRAMTPERARAIYATDYWSRIAGDQLPEGLQLPMLDAAVLQGPETAIRCLQRALYLTDDGVLGPATLGAARRADSHMTLARLTAERIERFAALPTFGRFGSGWTCRAVLAALDA